MLVVTVIPVLAASRGEPRQVTSPTALAVIVDGTWTNDTLARTIPPGPYAYNADLGVIAYTRSFDTNFIAALEPSTNGAIVLYRMTVTETNTTPRERVYRNTASIPVYTTTVSMAGYPTSWIEDVYGNPPPWLSGSNLADWYANRDPARQRVHVVLIATSDVPAYVAMLTNAVGSITSGTNMIPLLDLYSNDIAFVHLAAGNGPNLYLHAPEDVQRLDIYDSTNLVPLMGEWLLSATLDHVSDPLLWTWSGAASNVFFSAGNPDVDNDGDGLADIREIRLYGTNPTKRDTDGDGLSDGAEVLIYDLDPLDTDSDDDGFSDGWEVFVALYPTDPDAQTNVVVTGRFGDTNGNSTSEKYTLRAVPFGETGILAAWTNGVFGVATVYTQVLARGETFTFNLRWYAHDLSDTNHTEIDHDYQLYLGEEGETRGWKWKSQYAIADTNVNTVYSPSGTVSTAMSAHGHLGNHWVDKPTTDVDFGTPKGTVNAPPGKRVDVYVPLVDLDPANASNLVVDAWIGENESPGTIMAVSTSTLRRVRFTRGPESMPTGTVTLAIVSGTDRIRVWRDPAKGATNLLLSASSPSTNWVLTGSASWFAIPTNLWIEGITNSTTIGDVVLVAGFTSPASSTLCADTNVFTVLKVDLDIWNGGADLDNGQATGPQGAQVPEGSEVSTGAYVLVNWDDDDDTPTDFTTTPNPDLNQTGTVNHEDNLAKLKPTVEPLLDVGTVELEVSGADAGKVKLWTQSTKGTQITLTSNKKTWNLANSTEKADFQTFMNDGYWIEGTDTGTVERGVTFTVRYKDSGGTEICKDDNKATVMLLELGVGAYRENALGGGFGERGHGGLVFRYDGQCIRADLTNDVKYAQLEMFNSFGGPQVRDLTYATHYPDTPPPAYYGLCRPADLNYVERLKILKVAYYLKDNGGSIWYVGVDAIEIDGFTWDGTTVNEKLDDVDALRCDGLVELCYEINSVDAWGKIVSGSTHYSIYTYTSEHNDFVGDWEKYLQPFTQCAKSTTYKGTLWDTTFTLISGKTNPALTGP